MAQKGTPPLCSPQTQHRSGGRRPQLTHTQKPAIATAAGASDPCRGIIRVEEDMPVQRTSAFA